MEHFFYGLVGYIAGWIFALVTLGMVRHTNGDDEGTRDGRP